MIIVRSLLTFAMHAQVPPPVEEETCDQESVTDCCDAANVEMLYDVWCDSYGEQWVCLPYIVDAQVGEFRFEGSWGWDASDYWERAAVFHKKCFYHPVVCGAYAYDCILLFPEDFEVCKTYLFTGDANDPDCGTVIITTE